MKKLLIHSGERRRDPRVNREYSLENFLRKCAYRVGAKSIVIADSWGRVLAEYGAEGNAQEIAMIPGNDPLYTPSQVQQAIYDSEPYVNRLFAQDEHKVWPFRFAQGVGYVICLHPKRMDWLHTTLEDVSAGFRRILLEERMELMAA
ncbi:MAG TPA: hypothetical protein DCE42_02480 [Myxococcales bacterium]|nr:hypothetical protein [Deltaproteobacteria bacterium]MBU54377.1 hypothetical protein [Deltaproteobacteria bacterium]HAA53591.1 hypothetical protein [Myxococcales bacterium]